MLLFGDYKCLVRDDRFIIYNLSSLLEGYEMIKIIPPFIKQFNDEKQFDIMYANYLLSDDDAFYEMMKVVMALYMGNDVFVLVTKEDNSIFEILTESFQKFLQQRYGLISYNINCLEDLEYIIDDQQFNLIGLYNLDIDRERFTYMYYSKHPEELKG